MALAAPALEDAASGGSGGRDGVVTDRVLVRAPNWVGDTVLSLPALRDVRRNFPGARLEVLARPGVADVYRAVAEVDAVRESSSFGRDVAALRGAFDLGVLLPNSFASALLLYRAGIPERFGYATDGRGWLLTRRCRVPAQVRGESEVYYYRAMLAGVGLTVTAAPDVSLRVPEAWRGAARGLLNGKGSEDGSGGGVGGPGVGAGAPWLGINPGAAYGTAKRWIPERYAAVADRLAKRHGLRPVIVGGPGEVEVARRIAAAMKTPTLVLCGRTTLGELLGVIAELRLLLTNDSGPMHLAAAVGTKIVAVIGPTDWRETHPFTPRAVLVREPVPCAPCKLRECPIDHGCMTGVTVERVAAAAEQMLEAA
jgi:heptosyltransferase-2